MLASGLHSSESASNHRAGRFGCSRVIVLSVLLKPLLDRFGELGTLKVGLLANLAFTIYYGFIVRETWMVCKCDAFPISSARLQSL